MFCPKCGKINPDNAQVCSGCGVSLEEEVAVTATKKKPSALKFVVAAAIIVIAVIVLVLFLNGCGTLPRPEENMAF